MCYFVPKNDAGVNGLSPTKGTIEAEEGRWRTGVDSWDRCQVSQTAGGSSSTPRLMHMHHQGIKSSLAGFGGLEHDLDPRHQHHSHHPPSRWEQQ